MPMTIHKTYAIRCDQSGCDTSLIVHANETDVAIAAARRARWAVANDKKRFYYPARTIHRPKGRQKHARQGLESNDRNAKTTL